MIRCARSVAALLTLSLACAREPAVASDPPQDGAGVGASLAASGEDLAIVAVFQRDPPAVSTWRFGPGGQRIAAVGRDNSCGVWDIPSGLFVGLVEADGRGDPCRDWPASYELLRAAGGRERSSDGMLEAGFDESRRQVEVRWVASGELLSRVPVSSRGSLEGLDLAWSSGPSRKLAVLATDPPALEVWNLDGGEPTRALKFEPKFAPREGWLAWREDGLTAVTRHDAEVSCEENGSHLCEYDDSGDSVPFAGEGVSSFFWPDPVDGPMAATKRLEPAHADGDSVDFAFDDQLRWLAFTGEREVPRAGLHTRVWVVATGPRDDPRIGLSRSGDQYASQDTSYGFSRSHRVGAWREGAAPMWLERRIDHRYVTGGEYRVEMSWSSLVIGPTPSLREQFVFEGYGDELALVEAFDVLTSGAGFHVHCDVCVGKTCYSQSAVPDGCEPMVGVPHHEVLVASCGGQLSLVVPADAGRSATIERSLTFSAAAILRWGQVGWLALLEPGDGRLEVIDPGSGEVWLRRDKVRELLPTPLAIEQDRLAVVYADRFELLEPGPGGGIVRLSLAGAVEAAALSPDGERVAVSVDGRLEIYTLSDGQRVASWAHDGLPKLAWRQDGAVLFSGELFPERVYDVVSGARLRQVASTYSEVRPLHIDPDWRWAHMWSNRFLRMLDGRTIELGPGWARLDTGQFEGEPPDKKLSQLSFRLGSDPEAVPRYTSELLARWLSRPGLVEDFFAGKPIAAPTIPATEAARLLAGQAL